MILSPEVFVIRGFGGLSAVKTINLKFIPHGRCTGLLVSEFTIVAYSEKALSLYAGLGKGLEIISL
jgi:hypothetical protein